MTTIRPLTAILERYERWAMRRYARQVNAFLLVPGDVRQRRSVQKLRLQTVGRGWDDKIDQWVTAAIAEWGVEDFELVVNGSCVSYDLRLLDRYQDLRLRRLALTNCQPVPIWNSSTLQGLTKLSLGQGSYMGLINDILRNCVQLTDFRISDTGYFSIIFSYHCADIKGKESASGQVQFLENQSCLAALSRNFLLPWSPNRDTLWRRASAKPCELRLFTN
ncbi:hypothetical protein PR202_ga13753 [Eleusine coracana subsp. coracana]|uniref:Uncharacterized protein n=1 Tax=Eleusine coracana subsp. coracana TaxID=191504 RepID=A0AAV5CFT4_ELECO|nr:hypothetical protein PR202_ga13753 [Eleusine coracana subsp. coracana]